MNDLLSGCQSSVNLKAIHGVQKNPQISKPCSHCKNGPSLVGAGHRLETAHVAHMSLALSVTSECQQLCFSSHLVFMYVVTNGWYF